MHTIYTDIKNNIKNTAKTCHSYSYKLFTFELKFIWYYQLKIYTRSLKKDGRINGGVNSKVSFIFWKHSYIINLAGPLCSRLYIKWLVIFNKVKQLQAQFQTNESSYFCFLRNIHLYINKIILYLVQCCWDLT